MLKTNKTCVRINLLFLKNKIKQLFMFLINKIELLIVSVFP